MKIALVAAFIIAAVAALFATQNAQHTQVSFLTWYFEAPLVMILMLTFAAGAATALLALFPSSVRKSLEIKRLKAQSPPSHEAGTEGAPVTVGQNGTGTGSRPGPGP